MRRLITLLPVAGLAAATFLGTASITAYASVSVPAPSCDSFSSEIDCLESSSPAGVTVTWSLFSHNHLPPSWTVSGGRELVIGCVPGWAYTISYSYTSGGVTYQSLGTGLLCTKGSP